MNPRTVFGLALFALPLLSACDSTGVAEATCARREECGNLMGLTFEACVSTEEAYLESLAGGRGTCEAAWDACLDGEICDDFRECHADIGPETCGCPDVRVAILDPVDGQVITSADDADPTDSQIQYDFVIETSCLEEFEQVELYLLEPAESSFGFGAPDGTGRATIRAPLFPGTNRLLARGTTTTVQSDEVTVNVAP